MNQQNMFGKLKVDPYGGQAPNNGVDTSKEAGASVQAILGALQAKVLRYIRSRGEDGATCDEVEAHLNMRHQTASARVRELVLKEGILYSGNKRRTRSGRNARVYVTPEFHADIV
jgi:hypothetical protein